MPSFPGFKTDDSGLVPLPAQFFTDILPQIGRPCELKVTLHIFWLVSQIKQSPKCICRKDLDNDELLHSALLNIEPNKTTEQLLQEGLELAVRRGTVLRLSIRTSSEPEEWYSINTAHNRQLLARLRRSGTAAVAEFLGRRKQATVEPDVESEVNIFTLYEENIGVVTPLIGEMLEEAKRIYPADWLQEAFTEAVSLNKRNWRYISRILENWATQGRDSAKNRRDSRRHVNAEEYRTGKYAHLFHWE